MHDEWDKVNEIYQKIKDKIEPQFKGKIIAIDPQTEEFFLGETEGEAYTEGQKKYPGKTFYYKRVGFKATHFIPSLFEAKSLNSCTN